MLLLNWPSLRLITFQFLVACARISQPLAPIDWRFIPLFRFVAQHFLRARKGNYPEQTQIAKNKCWPCRRLFRIVIRFNILIHPEVSDARHHRKSHRIFKPRLSIKTYRLCGRQIERFKGISMDIYMPAGSVRAIMKYMARNCWLLITFEHRCLRVWKSGILTVSYVARIPYISQYFL